MAKWKSFGKKLWNPHTRHSLKDREKNIEDRWNQWRNDEDE